MYYLIMHNNMELLHSVSPLVHQKYQNHQIPLILMHRDLEILWKDHVLNLNLILVIIHQMLHNNHLLLNINIRDCEVTKALYCMNQGRGSIY